MKNITQAPIRTKNNNMTLNAPTTVHVELTSGCNLRCRHCYNYWRHDKVIPSFLTREKLDFILNELICNRVMHVIFTGGEPLLNYDNLCYGIKRLKENNISVSCNSNLLLATKSRMRELKQAGLDHVLTSLNSYNSKINDFIVSRKGSFRKVTKAIDLAIQAGIKISVNMIITKNNISHVYKTGKLAATLGAKSFFATRVVPNVEKTIDEQKEFLTYGKEAKFVIEELQKVRNDFSMRVGSLIPYPYCFLRDVEKYKDFYMHGCPAGNKMMSINADGNVHACVHESQSYGSIFKIGLKGTWKNMYKLWQKGEVFPGECKKCQFFEKCNSGCPLIARASNKEFGTFDILRQGWDQGYKAETFTKTRYNLKHDKFYVSEKLRFREDKGFYVIDRFGSEIVCVKNKLAKKIIKYFKNKKPFTLADFRLNHKDNFVTLIDQKIIQNLNK